MQERLVTSTRAKTVGNMKVIVVFRSLFNRVLQCVRTVYYALRTMHKARDVRHARSMIQLLALLRALTHKTVDNIPWMKSSDKTVDETIDKTVDETYYG